MVLCTLLFQLIPLVVVPPQFREPPLLLCSRLLRCNALVSRTARSALTTSRRPSFDKLVMPKRSPLGKFVGRSTYAMSLSEMSASELSVFESVKLHSRLCCQCRYGVWSLVEPLCDS